MLVDDEQTTFADDRQIAARDDGAQAETSETVGYCRPPIHTRFKPGQSGNPSGRAKGSKNLKTLFRKILNEEVSLREGSAVRNVTKGEAILRGLVVGALKGDSRSIGTLFRLAEQTGQLEDPHTGVTSITRVIVHSGVPRAESGMPGGRDINREDP
jgi:Family of unknown function (DUF5681)